MTEDIGLRTSRNECGITEDEGRTENPFIAVAMLANTLYEFKKETTDRTDSTDKARYE